jgi:hypothetical protein
MADDAIAFPLIPLPIKEAITHHTSLLKAYVRGSPVSINSTSYKRSDKLKLSPMFMVYLVSINSTSYKRSDKYNQDFGQELILEFPLIPLPIKEAMDFK